MVKDISKNNNQDMTSLIRWYIDTRHLTNTTEELPLVEKLRENDQKAVKRYLRLPDQHMSLASNLLKYLFVHRHCRIPWSEVAISRTPKPHQRPCFIPTEDQKIILLPDGSSSPIPTIEFNVSHQASFVAIGGCVVPPAAVEDKSTLTADTKPSSAPNPAIPQVGIDITCVFEEGRRRDKPPQTLEEVFEFIDIFSDVFSEREVATMKQKFTINHATSSAPKSLENIIQATTRLFYAYWALKEAYVKMTGEALLAPWLRELEFTNVVAPAALSSNSAQWGQSYTGVQTWLYGKRVEDVRVELVAFESDYLLATAARGANLGSAATKIPLNGEDKGIDVHAEGDSWGTLESIDIERDVRPCATGTCQCLG